MADHPRADGLRGDDHAVALGALFAAQVRASHGFDVPAANAIAAAALVGLAAYLAVAAFRAVRRR